MRVKHKKLKEWVAAGLMTDAQADIIHDYEENRRKGGFGRGLVGLSLFAIVIGVLSVIAANWYAIPGDTKIGAHVLLNAFVGWVAWRADKNGNNLWREGATFTFVGLTMTLILLIGQVYQLDGKAVHAFSLWMVITFPFFMLLGRGYMTAIPWMIAFLSTLSLVVGEYFDLIPDKWEITAGLSLTAFLPLLLIGKGLIPWFQKFRPALADTCHKIGIVWLLVMASCCLAFYHFMFEMPGEMYMQILPHFMPVLGAGLAMIGVHAALHKFYKDDPAMKLGALFVLVSFVAQFLPLLLHGWGGILTSAILFLGYWIFIGWLGQMTGRMRIVSLAITVIAIRIFVVYIELFGTLFDTGIGLIVGGVVMLSLLYGARKMNTRLTKGGVNA